VRRSGEWRGIPLRDYVIYELHVGTFTQAGTFDGAIHRLDDLVSLGVTAIELMPIAQFPGPRNWGYDGVYPYAPQSSYGGPDGLARLIDAAHGRGLAVVLDVVYNHLGPEGCYLDAFGPYFTDRYKTPWGRALNFDGPGSDEVRRYFIANALYWIEDFRIDALRLDAVHAIADASAFDFVEELAVAVQRTRERLGRDVHLIAESASNDARLITQRDNGGVGLDAQWNDDFHHALYAIVTGERDGYFGDYGDAEHVARAYADGFVYQGEYSAFRGRRHGRASAGLSAERFVVYGNNHDQIGNRPQGDRLSTRVSFEELKLLATAVLLSPYVPLLFMGEEYGETAPFPYFVSHSDPALIAAVREGRRREFIGSPGGEAPDAQDESTFLRAKLDASLKGTEPHATLRRFYAELLSIRKTVTPPDARNASVVGATVVVVHMTSRSAELALVLNLGDTPADVALPTGDTWELSVDSADERWRGPGTIADRTIATGATTAVQPKSATAYRRSGS
jgi:maltooligosyltrehalose trehalohydrolase